MVRHLYSGGKDFTDRPPEESLLGTLEEMEAANGEFGGGEPEIRVSAEEAENETVRPDKPAITLEQLGPYYLGTYFATVAMHKKLEDLGPEGEDPSERVDAYQNLVNEYSAAIQETAGANGG